MRRLAGSVLFLIFLLTGLSSALATTVATGPQWAYLQTPPSASFQQIEKLAPDQWQAIDENGLINLGFTSDSLWLRTRFQPDKPGKQVLELNNPMHDRVTLYILRDDKPPEIRQGGFRQPPDRSLLSHFHNQLFDFDLAAGESATLLLNVDTSRPIFVWPRLTNVQDFFHISANERLLLGIYCGLFVTLCLYSLMAWASTRDSNYLDYFMFLSLVGLLQAHLLGLWHETFLQTRPWLMDFLSSLLPSLALAALCRFARNYLNLSELSPPLYRAMTACTWLALTPTAVQLAFGSHYSIPMLDIISVLFSGLGIYAGFQTLHNGFRPARFYLLAQIPLVGGGLLYVGANFGLLHASPFTMFGFQLGAGLGTVMIALALAGKLRALQKAQMQAHADHMVAEQQLIEVLRESEFQLEARVQERTRQLEEALEIQRHQRETLESANHSLQTLHQERGAFLQIAAHDLKNPTAAILSYADLLRERWHAWDDDKKIKRLGNIRSMAQLTFDIIRNLLDVDAIESGHYVLRPVRVDAGQTLATIAEEYRQRCETKDLSLQLTLCAEPLALQIDRTAFHQILDNLISNAVKYSPHGRKVHVSLIMADEQARIEIRDEGPGISEADQARLFRKFTRLSARPTGGEHSTGLGLSIVKYMTEASGGKVGCVSRLGEGACFYVCLPLAPQPKPAATLTA